MRIAIFIVLLLALSPMYNSANSLLEEDVATSETSHHTTVAQFGVGFSLKRVEFIDSLKNTVESCLGRNIS